MQTIPSLTGGYLTNLITMIMTTLQWLTVKVSGRMLDIICRTDMLSSLMI